ncbi:MAG: M28 family peptidase [Deltaproteobacteria bacterium]|nr:M28 family peptidase [Deltaproteobacteria bacterium]
MNTPRARFIASCLALGGLLSASGCRHGAGPSAPAEDADPLQAAVDGIRAEDIANHVRVLASDAFEGRFPGSAGEAKTVAYISAHFARHGLEPAVDGSYLQSVPLVSVTLADQTTAQLTGADGQARALRVPEDIVIGSASPRARVELADAEVVFVGHGIVAPEFGWDDYAQIDVRGKVVLVVPGDPGPARDDATFFEGRALTLYGTRSHKAEQAAQRGAVGLLTLHDDDGVGVPWKVLAQGARRPHQQLDRDDGPATVAIMGSIPRAGLMAALDEVSRERFEQARLSAGGQAFTPHPLPLRLSASLHRDVESIVSHNVVGIIRGATRPDEHVIYTAHWDHVGRNDDRPGDGIYNGAVDNATGTAALLELAEAYAALPGPAGRSVVLVATTAEEQGLLGAKWYVDQPVLPLADAVGVINMDALFPFGRSLGMTVVALGSSDLDTYMDAAARTVGRRLYPDPAPEYGAFFRSDHYPFARRGVPAIFAVGGPSPDAPDAAQVERFVEYIQTRYHQVGDEYDASTWDMAGIVQDVTIYFRTGHAIAMDDHRPQWTPTSPFRARHEALRAGR